MLPWMCGRQTLTIVVSSPCMTQAQITVAVIMPRLGAGRALSPLTPSAFAVVAAQRLFVLVYRAVAGVTRPSQGIAGRSGVRYQEPVPHGISTAQPM